MSIKFNPLNPLSYVNAAATAVTNAELAAPRVAKGTPIPVTVASEDRGIKVARKTTAGRTVVSFAGTAKGPGATQPKGPMGDYFGPMAKPRVVSLSVATSEAPTTDSFGNTNFTEKNHRALIHTTHEKQTGRDLAEAFAKDINANIPAFHAEVTAGPTADSAKLVITRT